MITSKIDFFYSAPQNAIDSTEVNAEREKRNIGMTPDYWHTINYGYADLYDLDDASSIFDDY